MLTRMNLEMLTHRIKKEYDKIYDISVFLQNIKKKVCLKFTAQKKAYRVRRPNLRRRPTRWSFITTNFQHLWKLKIQSLSGAI